MKPEYLKGNFCGFGVSQPVDGPDGDADGGDDEHEPPPDGRGLSRADDFSQSSLESFEVLAGHLLHAAGGRHGCGWVNVLLVLSEAVLGPSWVAAASQKHQKVTSTSLQP